MAPFESQYQAGLGLVRDIQATRALMEDREAKKAAEKWHTELMGRTEKRMDKIESARAAFEDALAERSAGKAVSEEHLENLQQAADQSWMDGMREQAEELVPHTSSPNKYIAQAASKGFEKVNAALTTIANDRGNAETAEANRERTEVAAQNAATNERTAGVQERRVTVEESREAREQKKYEEEALDPLKQLEYILDMSAGVAKMDAAGVPEAQQDKALAPTGLKSADVRDRFADFTEKTKGELKVLESHRDKLLKRQAAGEKGIGPMVQRVREQISKVQKIDDQIMDASIAKAQWNEDNNAARVASEDFFEWLERGAKKIAAYASAPFIFGAQGIAGEDRPERDPAKEARSSSRVNY